MRNTIIAGLAFPQETIQGTACGKPAETDLCMVQGDTYQHLFTWVDADGNPIDLTGASCKMQVRRTISSDPPLFEATELDDITLGDALGTIQLAIAPASTTLLPRLASGDEMPVYDIEVTLTDGTVTTVVRGSVDVTSEVTR